MPNLSDAINAVEGAQTAYTNSTTTVSNDQSAATAIQVKLAAANKQVQDDQATQVADATALNASLQDLINAATAAMISVPAPAAA